MGSDRSPAIVHGASVDENVRNGQVYEKGALDASSFAELVVPRSSKILEGGASGTVELFLEKSLGFVGHPGSPIDIALARGYMGAASKAEGKTLTIGTYGEWTSIEGGAALKLVIKTPKGLAVRKAKGLSSYKSAANGHGVEPDQALLKKCYWYGPISPAAGWTRIATELDLARTAGSK